MGQTALTSAVLFLYFVCCNGLYFPASRGFAGAAGPNSYLLLQAVNETHSVVSWTMDGGQQTEMLTGSSGALRSYINRVSVTNIWDTDIYFMVTQESDGHLMMRLLNSPPYTFSLIPTYEGLINWVKVASSERQSAVTVFTCQPIPGNKPSPYGGLYINFHTPLSEFPYNPKLHEPPLTYKPLGARTSDYAFQPNICAIGAARYVVVWGVTGANGIFASITDVWGNLMHSPEPYKIDTEGVGVLTPSCVMLHDKNRLVVSYMVMVNDVEPGMYVRARMFTNFSTPEVFDGFNPIADYYPMADNQFQPSETTYPVFTKRTVYGKQNIEPALIACGKGFAISWVTYFGVFVQSYGILEERIRFDSLDVELSWARIIDAADEIDGMRASLLPSTLVDLSQQPAPMGPQRENQVDRMWVVSYWDYNSYWNLPGQWYAGGWVAVEWPEVTDYIVPGLFKTIEIPSPDGPRGRREDVGVTVGENSIVVYWKEVFTNRVTGEEDYDFYWQLFDEHMVPRKMETQKVIFQLRGTDYAFTLPVGIKCSEPLTSDGRCLGRTDPDWHKPEYLKVGLCHNGFILVGRSENIRILSQTVLWYQAYEWTGRAIPHKINFDIGVLHWDPWKIRIVMPAALYPQTHIYYLQNTTLSALRKIDYLNSRMFQIVLDGNMDRPPMVNRPFLSDLAFQSFDVATHPTDPILVFAVVNDNYGWCFKYNLLTSERHYETLVGDNMIIDVSVTFQHTDLIVFSMKVHPFLTQLPWKPKYRVQYYGNNYKTFVQRDPIFSDFEHFANHTAFHPITLYPDQSAVFAEFNGSCCHLDFYVRTNPNGIRARWKAAVVFLLHDKFPATSIIGKYKGMWLSNHLYPDDTFNDSYNMYPSMDKNTQLGLVCAWTEPVPGGNSIFLQAVGADSPAISGLNISSLPDPTPVPVETKSPGVVFGPDGIYTFSAPPGEDWWNFFTNIPGFPTRAPYPAWLPIAALRGVYFDYYWNGTHVIEGYSNRTFIPAFQTFSPTRTHVPNSFVPLTLSPTIPPQPTWLPPTLSPPTQSPT
eukprot:TRINITY_DN17509_c0_g1_i2.p1 TRINITY_DN17509_c0_g1~~TRINITY_DN17509_c0_g1_i2.p1  ORF type:complete len:1049 (+),score=65.81 TRINITY_DN17509_c0_g1_i2:26-3148(+)